VFPDPVAWSSQAIFPLGIAITYLALCLYVLFSRKPDNDVDRLFLGYLVITSLWSLNLAVLFNPLPALLPALTWANLAGYGLIILGLVYWAFARAFLNLSWRVIWVWLTGLVSLILTVAFNLGWLIIPPQVHTWSNNWIPSSNVGFTLCVGGWAFFMGLTALTTFGQTARTFSPAHRNRIQYLLVSTLILMIGYGLYLTLREPLWTTGLILVGLGGVLATYTVVIEELMDLGTSLRRVISGLMLLGMTMVVYLAGLYLVWAFLGDYLTQIFNGYVDPMVALITALLLLIVYPLIRKTSLYFTSRFLFGQHYDYQKVIRDYGQVINHRLYLGDLTSMATQRIGQTLGVNRNAIFILDQESDGYMVLYTFPALGTNGVPKSITLHKDTPITRRLVVERRPLSQYTVDISLQFKSAPEEDRQTLKSLNYEWFIPILKENQLLGVFALGAKKSGQPYSAQDMHLLTTLADQTALALENATLFDGLQRHLAEMTRMKNLMDNIFDSMESGVITTDMSGNVTLYNRAAAAILATPPEQCVGLPYAQVWPSLSKTIFPNLVNDVARRETHYTNYELTSELPQRGQVNLSLNLAPLKDEGDQTQGVTIVVDDITETKRLRAVHNMFRRYVSPAVVDRLPANPVDLQLGGYRQVVTILFADIRGFTRFSEKMPPEKLVDTLNEYLSIAGASILMFEGTLDKFIGDAVMGIFNAPLEQPDHVLRAVRAAATMQRAIADFHHNIGEDRTLSFGVGIHVGEAVVGNVGMSDRMDYTAIGDTVNVAKRIQESTPGGKVLMSQAVYQVVKTEVKAVFAEEMQLRGREQPVRVYELISA
jgi:PAS domain S-box-containing protein